MVIIRFDLEIDANILLSTNIHGGKCTLIL